MSQILISVPDITCGHCVSAITGEVCAVPGVTAVDVDVAAKTVRVSGGADVRAVRAAIAEAGYRAA